MTDDAVEIVARAIAPSIWNPADVRSEQAEKLRAASIKAARRVLSELEVSGYAIVPAATIAQRDATIERLGKALKPFTGQNGYWSCAEQDFRAARAAYDGTGEAKP